MIKNSINTFFIFKLTETKLWSLHILFGVFDHFHSTKVKGNMLRDKEGYIYTHTNENLVIKSIYVIFELKK